MPQISNLTVAILAGGQSNRFGYPKMFAKYGQKTFLEHCLHFSLELSKSVFILIGCHARSYFNFPHCYQDLYSHHGPLGGIYTALQYSPAPYIAIVPCDMPFLSQDIYRELYTFRQPHRPIAAQVDHYIHPLVSLWPKELAVQIEKNLQRNKNCVNDIFKTLRGLALPIMADAAVFSDMNTQKDYNFFKLKTTSQVHATRY